MNLLEILIKKVFLKEGVEDPSILKCIFLAGGPGSGKSYIAKDLFNIPADLPLSSYGLKLVNSDNAFEFLLKKDGLSLDLSKLSPEDFKKVTAGPTSIREKAKKLTQKKLHLYRQNKLGIIIDGTGDTIDNIQHKKRVMEIHGYDCYMVFVNTDLDIALERNKKRERKLPEHLVKEIWKKCQRNIGHFQNIFGTNFTVIDNSEPDSIQASMYRSIRNFIHNPVQNPVGRKWMENYYKLSNFANEAPPTPPKPKSTTDPDLELAPIKEPMSSKTTVQTKKQHRKYP